MLKRGYDPVVDDECPTGYVDAAPLHWGLRHYGYAMQPAAGGGNGGYALCTSSRSPAGRLPPMEVFDQEAVDAVGLGGQRGRLADLPRCPRCLSKARNAPSPDPDSRGRARGG
jgi:hypothetical protein